jgi:hypothetical protein
VHACISEAAFAPRTREAGRGVFYLLFLLAYAFTVPITFLTCESGVQWNLLCVLALCSLLHASPGAALALSWHVEDLIGPFMPW